jgi:hypothetical protein
MGEGLKQREEEEEKSAGWRWAMVGSRGTGARGDGAAGAAAEGAVVGDDKGRCADRGAVVSEHMVGNWQEEHAKHASW